MGSRLKNKVAIVIGVALFLASDEARAINGIELRSVRHEYLKCRMHRKSNVGVGLARDGRDAVQLKTAPPASRASPLPH